MRDFWRGEAATLGEFASRFTGSSDLYEHSGRKPIASINFTVAHDGFTLRDLVSYNEKHNEANGEDNNDGDNNNGSWNCGVEGPTDDPAVTALRLQQSRNFWTTLALSQGVPMVAHGDELGRTQGGNNNAYCQDDEISWVDWDLDESGTELLTFAQRVLRMRHDHPVFKRRRFFAGSADHGGESALGDVAWFMPNGKHMDEAAWSDGFARSLMVFLNGDAIPELDRRGQTIVDDSFLVVFNAHHETISFTLPEEAYGAEWFLEIDTAGSDEATTQGDGTAGVAAAPVANAPANAAAAVVAATELDAGSQFDVQARSIMVLRCPRVVA